MSFVNPQGLLGLIGIPIVIIIYIIKRQYTEQTIPSVYLWKLSERFLKRKARFTFLSGLVSLILQILIITAISLTVAQPVFVIKGVASDYYFVLDGSGSMNTVQGETTRFDAAKEQIENIVTEAKSGSVFTLSFVSGDSNNVLFEKTESKEQVINQLDALTCGWSSSDCKAALSDAQSYYDENRSALVYLFTDKEYQTQNATLVNVSDNSDNFALLSYSTEKDAGGVSVSGYAVSYNSDQTLNLVLNIILENGEEVTVDQKQVQAKKGEPCEYVLECDRADYVALVVKIINEDGLMTDNEGIIYVDAGQQDNKTLLVSDNDLYIVSALKAIGTTSVVSITPRRYNEAPEAFAGYGLYIFDFPTEDKKENNKFQYVPESLPTNATIWLFNLQKSIPGTGFGVTEKQIDEESDSSYFEARFNTSTASSVQSFLKYMPKRPVAVKRYMKYIPNRNFTNLLTYKNDNLIFAGLNENGDRQVTFAFDLHDTNNPLSIDMLVLFKNLLDYSFPTILDSTLYEVGETLTINMLAGCTNLEIESPSGKMAYPSIESSVAEWQLTEAGSYKISVTINNQEHLFSVYSALPESESFAAIDEEFLLQGALEHNYSDGKYDDVIIYLILLILVFFADWGVYCYEQYQIR